MVHLSNRMKAISSLVSPGLTLCDVGCDHGFLPIALVQEQKIKRAIAIDINPGPLQAGRKNIEEAGFSDVIETRLSDGLLAVMPKEADSILIAGMGGGLVLHILEQSKEVVDAAKELILQPQSEIQEVRKYLMEQGFAIVEEDMVLEDGKYYPMMKVQGNGSKINYTEAELYFGPCLLHKKHEVLLDFLKREKRIQHEVLENLQQAKETSAILKRKEEVEKYLSLVEEAMASYT